MSPLKSALRTRRPSVSNQPITAEKKQQLAARMARLDIHENDLSEHFILGAGPGGQKINKTAACVRLRHEPSGIAVKCGRTRHRELNRFLARRKLCERVEEQRTDMLSARQQAIEKIRRQKRRRSRRQRMRILDDKRRHGEKKQHRAAVLPWD